jgi:hypothetical protein
MQRNYLYVVGSRVSRKTRNQRTGSVKLSSSNKQLGLRKRLGSWELGIGIGIGIFLGFIYCFYYPNVEEK